MSINVLLSALEEYLTVKRDVAAGCQDETALVGAKKRFAQALNQYIDWRTDGVLEERKRRISTSRSVKIADLLTSSMDGVTSSVAALNAAPTPPDIDKIANDKSGLEAWFKAYQDWYNTTRKKGLTSL
jgi:hypothetical protein